jgi:uncharacterized membrane protein YphA (DoxX/SURF4 family)
MVVEGPLAAEAFLAARVLFGAVLAFMGINHFMDAEAMTGYAASKGLPAPGFGVIASGVVLLGGGLGIAAGVFPVVAAGALAAFLAVATPVMHDFWAAPEDQQQAEMTNFLKNVALLGGALAFLALGGSAWPYAVGIGVF